MKKHCFCKILNNFIKKMCQIYYGKPKRAMYLLLDLALSLTIGLLTIVANLDRPALICWSDNLGDRTFLLDLVVTEYSDISAGLSIFHLSSPNFDFAIDTLSHLLTKNLGTPMLFDFLVILNLCDTYLFF